MAPVRPLAILLALAVSDLHGLPWFVNVSESQGPGALLWSFSFNCSSGTPSLKLLWVQPPSPFFNPPSLARWQGLHVGQLTLSSSARLDALAVNHYELQLQVTCGSEVIEGPLSVNVQRDPDRAQCAGRFASPAGEVIQVPETVAPGARLYTVLPGLELQGAQANITSAQDPPYFPGPFSISGQGWLQAPAQGLRGQAPKLFGLQVMLTWGRGRRCHGVLGVRVLPAPASQLSFPARSLSVSVPEDLAPGSEVARVRARGEDVRYDLLVPARGPRFSIGRADGVVRTSAPLAVAVTPCSVRAFEGLRPGLSVQLDLTVNVTPVNRWPPRCLPALLLTQVPETAPVGTPLGTFTCEDPDSPDSPLRYQLQAHSPRDLASLRLRDRVLEVNATLDCDVPGACFQLAASLLVLDSGQPPMSTEVPVLVTVTPVNEFSPACAPRTFRVREDAGPRTLLGSVVASDMDYPHAGTEFHSPGGPAPFAVDRLSGAVRLLGPLDYEQQRLHQLPVLVTDRGHGSGSCTVAVEVEDVNEHAPECEPPFQELAVHASPGSSTEVARLSCRVPQEPQRLAFSYSLVGGTPPSGPSPPAQPRTFELLIRVADAGPSAPHLSTTATVLVHLVPPRASTAATSTSGATVPAAAATPRLVTLTDPFWRPEPWFVVVLTVTGALLLALGWLLCRHSRGWAQGLRAPSKPAPALLLTNIQGTEGSSEGFMEAPRRETPRMETPEAPGSIRSLRHFDGRAQDSRTGRDYLFDTRMGAWRWL
uniref:Cadherin related family member 4 n=1 Tax=Pipistrellus kuhlii TaxID=59472 RepID=A0A7J7WCB1_PIPKU|nr:cadherin related family member 4 [Pipistrellus kuhlii]